MSAEITYQYFRPDKSPELLDQVVECYRRVFADRPWNEWKRCRVCGAYWGIDKEAELQSIGYAHCEQQVADYWPAFEVEQDIRHEVSGQASCWLALTKDEVIGFCWGYPTDAKTLEEKLGVPVADTLAKQFGNVTIGYQDELGVLNAFRGKKIAKQLFLHRHADFRMRGVEVGVVRTRELPEPSVTYRWFTEKLGYTPVYRYPAGDGRIVLARALTDLEPLLRE